MRRWCGVIIAATISIARPLCRSAPADRLGRGDRLLRRPPRWRVYVETLGIVWRQPIQAQPFRLAAYRPARAAQSFGNLQRRICWPQSDKFAEFLVGPAGHVGLGMAAPAPGAMHADLCGTILAYCTHAARRPMAVAEKRQVRRFVSRARAACGARSSTVR